MTCIVAIKTRERILMGADSAATDGGTVYVMKDPKLHYRRPYLIGCAGENRIGMLIAHAGRLPKPEGNPDRHMTTAFARWLRELLAEEGAVKRGSLEADMQLLVAVCGRLYVVDGDYQAGRVSEDWAAVGNGADVALGVMYATKKKQPRARLRLALEAAENYCVGVRGPFIFRGVKR